MIYGKLTVHDRQTDEVHIEITRKGLAHTHPNKQTANAFYSLVWGKQQLRFSVGSCPILFSVCYLENELRSVVKTAVALKVMSNT